MTQSRDRLYDPEERRHMLQIARRAVIAALGGAPREEPPEVPPFLRERRGCFVTLKNAGGLLRGCIGTFDTTQPLLQTLASMAAAAARDSRFAGDPVTLDEADDLVVSVRVLTPLEPLSDPLLLDVGTEGIYIIGERDGRQLRGCFLPEVATEQGWDVEALVSHCCADKMKLSPGAWRPPTDLEFYRFRAIGTSE